jgi:DNA invertase Pin-like site-specific DNA recombinase
MAIDDAILYTRVSSDEQKKSGFSLDYQRKMGEEYAKINKLNIIKVYAESYTAKKPGRPQFNEMVDYCKKHKIKNLIFLKSDRASRNGVDSALLVYMAEHLDYNIHLIQDRLILNSSAKATDFLVFEINNCISNFYPRNLSVDVSTKMREKAEQGYYPSIAPIGYKNERINHR